MSDLKTTKQCKNRKKAFLKAFLRQTHTRLRILEQGHSTYKEVKTFVNTQTRKSKRLYQKQRVLATCTSSNPCNGLLSLEHDALVRICSFLNEEVLIFACVCREICNITKQNVEISDMIHEATALKAGFSSVNDCESAINEAQQLTLLSSLAFGGVLRSKHKSHHLRAAQQEIERLHTHRSFSESCMPLCKDTKCTVAAVNVSNLEICIHDKETTSAKKTRTTCSHSSVVCCSVTSNDFQCNMAVLYDKHVEMYLQLSGSKEWRLAWRTEFTCEQLETMAANDNCITTDVLASGDGRHALVLGSYYNEVVDPDFKHDNSTTKFVWLASCTSPNFSLLPIITTFGETCLEMQVCNTATVTDAWFISNSLTDLTPSYVAIATFQTIHNNHMPELLAHPCGVQRIQILSMETTRAEYRSVSLTSPVVMPSSDVFFSSSGHTTARVHLQTFVSDEESLMLYAPSAIEHLISSSPKTVVDTCVFSQREEQFKVNKIEMRTPFCDAFEDNEWSGCTVTLSGDGSTLACVSTSPKYGFYICVVVVNNCGSSVTRCIGEHKHYFFSCHGILSSLQHTDPLLPPGYYQEACVCNHLHLPMSNVLSNTLHDVSLSYTGRHMFVPVNEHSVLIAIDLHKKEANHLTYEMCDVSRVHSGRSCLVTTAYSSPLDWCMVSLIAPFRRLASNTSPEG